MEIGRLSCDSGAPQVGSARSDSTSVLKVNRRKTDRRKTRPHCMPSIKFRVEVEPHSFSNSALDGGEWSASLPGHFIPRERAYSTHWHILYFHLLRSQDGVGRIITRLRAGRTGFRVGSIRCTCEIPTHVKIVMRPIKPETQLGWCNWRGRPGQPSPRGGKMNILNEKIWFSALNNF